MAQLNNYRPSTPRWDKEAAWRKAERTQGVRIGAAERKRYIELGWIVPKNRKGV